MGERFETFVIILFLIMVLMGFTVHKIQIDKQFKKDCEDKWRDGYEAGYQYAQNPIKHNRIINQSFELYNCSDKV